MKIDQLRIGICGISLSICAAINAVPPNFCYADTDSNGIIRESDFMAVPAHLRSHEAQTFLNKVNMNNVFNDLNRLSANAIQSKRTINQHITPPISSVPDYLRTPVSLQKENKKA